MSKTCNSCKHFNKIPPQAGIVSVGTKRQGECRAALSPMAMVPQPNGIFIVVGTGYLPVTADFPACGRHEALVELGTNTVLDSRE